MSALAIYHSFGMDIVIDDDGRVYRQQQPQESLWNATAGFGFYPHNAARNAFMETQESERGKTTALRSGSAARFE
jgi:cold shock CspA family protein